MAVAKRAVSVFHPSEAFPQAVPLQIAQLPLAYNFPKGINLAGQSMAIMELGGGYLARMIMQFCDKHKAAHPQLFDHGVLGGFNNHIPGNADGEVDLDILIPAIVAAGLRIDMVFVPNSIAGIAGGFNYIANMSPRPACMSLSWGGPESGYGSSDIASIESAIKACEDAGIGCYVAQGDNGSDDGTGQLALDYPGSSPGVVGCGGTRLLLNADGSRNSEVVWSPETGNGATGGGLSAVFGEINPIMKAVTGEQKVAKPDISGNADPATGYEIEVDFTNQAVGGTSAVAPLMAALHVLLQSYFPTPIGSLRELLYAAPADVFFDVVQGDNGAYKATPGFDMCTGRGVPDGTKLLNYIVQSGHLQKAAAKHRASMFQSIGFGL